MCMLVDWDSWNANRTGGKKQKEREREKDLLTWESFQYVEDDKFELEEKDLLSPRKTKSSRRKNIDFFLIKIH